MRWRTYDRFRAEGDALEERSAAGFCFSCGEAGGAVVKLLAPILRLLDPEIDDAEPNSPAFQCFPSANLFNKG
jgi:hypothetical protein